LIFFKEVLLIGNYKRNASCLISNQAFQGKNKLGGFWEKGAFLVILLALYRKSRNLLVRGAGERN
jgi:hypothetical protein